jgi:hypothetical protein
MLSSLECQKLDLLLILVVKGIKKKNRHNIDKMKDSGRARI